MERTNVRQQAFPWRGGSTVSRGGLPDEFTQAELDALALDREYIKSALPVLKHKAMRQVLEASDNLREGRRVGGIPAVKRAEQTTNELVGEIMWRVSTFPPSDAKRIAQVVRDLLALRNSVSGQDKR
jgi:hypothetical protein